MGNQSQKYHLFLAQYFQSKSLYLDDPIQNKINIRKLEEQPWQCMNGNDWERLHETLIDLNFFLALREHGESTFNYWKVLPEKFNPSDYLSSWMKQCKKANLGYKELKIATHLGNFFLNIQVMSAEPFLNDAVKIADRIIANMNKNDLLLIDKSLLDSYSSLAKFFMDTSRVSEAEEVFRHVLFMAEKYFSNNQRIIAPFLSDLAWLLALTKRIVEAEILIRHAILIMENCGQQISLEFAKSLIVLGAIFHRKDQLFEAENVYYQALDITEKILGYNHQNVAQCLTNLGQILQANGKFNEAEIALKRALKIIDAEGQNESILTAVALNNLAQLLQQLERFDEAEPLSRRQVSILHRWGIKTSHNHPYLQASISNYTEILQKMGYSIENINTRISSILYTIPLIQDGHLLRD
jgi:tetratricopeptide (TPR) repeat protein